MSRMFLTPKAGLDVPSPDHGGQPLPADGDWVEASVYWGRRLSDKDVEQDESRADPEANPPPPAEPARRGKSSPDKEA